LHRQCATTASTSLLCSSGEHTCDLWPPLAPPPLAHSAHITAGTTATRPLASPPTSPLASVASLWPRHQFDLWHVGIVAPEPVQPALSRHVSEGLHTKLVIGKPAELVRAPSMHLQRARALLSEVVHRYGLTNRDKLEHLGMRTHPVCGSHPHCPCHH
jgi:hypothetical protein